MQNKITFIYDYKEGETWSTPLSLVNEFKKRGWETNIKSLYASYFYLGKVSHQQQTRVQSRGSARNPQV